MRILYLECGMGAAGDMLTSALLELHPDPDGFIGRMNALGMKGVKVKKEKAVKCGIIGTHVSVTIHGEQEESCDYHGHIHGEEHGYDEAHTHVHESHHHAHEKHSHSNMHSIEHIISHLDLPDAVKKDVLAVYGEIAQAESAAHGKSVEEIHFHEVGAMDAVADVTAVCWLLHELKVDRVVASPIHVGSGHVHCAHGILPVPAPATAYLLKGIPTYGGTVKGELCTPTGAALLRYFVSEFGSQPVMRVEKIGYGMGKKDFEAANCVRAMLGEIEERAGRIVELKCNLDDMTPEAIAFASEELFAAGALDVYTAAIGMKKGRSGILLACMCHMEQREEMLKLIFQHTTTLGVRETISNRYTLNRSVEMKETAYGPVAVKKSSGWGVSRQKVEYEDAARVAREHHIPLSQVLQ